MREHMGYEAAFRQGSRENAVFRPHWAVSRPSVPFSLTF